MSTEGDQPTRAQLIARAWHLSTQDGLSTRAVAREMGIPHSTARDYIREGVDSEAWIDLLDRGEARQALAMRTVRILDRLDKMMSDDPDRTLEVAPTWFKGAGQLAQLLGLNAPTRVQTETVSRSEQPDPEIAAAIKAAQAEAARDRSAIRGETALVTGPEHERPSRTEQDENGTETSP